jgi:hypothetical protein
LEDVKKEKSIVEKYLASALFTRETPKGTLKSQTNISRTNKPCHNLTHEPKIVKFDH